MAAALVVASTRLHASEADERIEPSFQQTFVYRAYFTTNDVVKTGFQGGVATLTGRVSDEFKKTLAQETVALLPGVTLVDNRLEITGEIPAVNSDAWLRAKVKNMLALHRCVSTRAEVEVKNGVVILRGQAISKNQSDLTSQYVYSVEGVTEVRNEMAVIAYSGNVSGVRGSKIDDASITAQANLTFQYHSMACALANKVMTHDGVVLLSGNAREVLDQDVAA